MRDTTNAVKVGAFVVLALVASVLVYRMVEERSGGEDGRRYWAVFRDASGLVPKSRVQIAGINVGYIDTITLWGQRARVNVVITSRDVHLREDATIAKRSASILGEFFLVITPGSPNRRVMSLQRTAANPDPGRIHTVVEDVSLGSLMESGDRVMQRIADIAGDVQRISQQVSRVFGTEQGGTQLAEILRNITELAAAVNRAVRENSVVIARTLQNVEAITRQGAPDIRVILENVREVTATLRDIVGREEVGRTVGTVADTTESIQRSAETLEGVLADIRQITDRTARGEGTLGRLTSDDQLIDEVQGVVEGVSDFIEPLSRLQTIVGLRSEYNFLANTLKSYVQLRIQPREDKYYLIEVINDPRGLTRTERTTVRSTRPDEPGFYQEERTVTSDQFRFSFQFARRIGPLTFRFGVIESTGGVGLDLHLFDDHFEMRSDLFEFGNDALPRFRVALSYEIIRTLWLLGGVDDIFNPERTDYFLGAQLRFNDEDLRSLLPFVGGAATGGQ
ncbi:MAG: MCE family protein [Deltaproteobacteria bacterium]|nr:MCE family protein [Deltaproteobacteria bacterium]